MQKNVLITGGTSGIGYQAVRLMLQNGCRVITICRNQERSKELILKIRNLEMLNLH